MLKSRLRNGTVPCPPSPLPELVTGPGPTPTGLVRTPCLPSGRSCKVVWQRARTYNSLRGRQCTQSGKIIHSITREYCELPSGPRQTWLWIWALPESFACPNPSHGLWPNAIPPISLFSYSMTYSLLTYLFKAYCVLGTGEQGRRSSHCLALNFKSSWGQ